MPTRNKVAGDGYERTLMHRYNGFTYKGDKGVDIPLFPMVGTSRNVDRFMDHEYKIDITTENRDHLRDFGLLIQAKNKSTIPAYPKLLASLKKAAERFKGCIPIVYHWQTQRVKNEGKAIRFMKRGEFCILNSEDFEKIWIDLHKHKIALETVLSYTEFLNMESQKEIDEMMKRMGL